MAAYSINSGSNTQLTQHGHDSDPMSQGRTPPRGVQCAHRAIALFKARQNIECGGAARLYAQPKKVDPSLWSVCLYNKTMSQNQTANKNQQIETGHKIIQLGQKMNTSE